ncbi:MAG: rod shape-determining protein [Actinobacteria bacterium]|nr:rod shape-determining protein [Actinomycetota bacterium]
MNAGGARHHRKAQCSLSRRAALCPLAAPRAQRGNSEQGRRSHPQSPEADEPVAAAIAAGLEIAEPSGKLIVDVGGGTSDVAVISLGGIVVSPSLRIGGFQLDEAVVAHVRREHKLALGQRTAEQLKFDLGSAHRLQTELKGEVRGRDLVSGLPRAAQLTSEELRDALSEPVGAIVEAVTDTLERTPPELASDIADRGIMLAGGGALLRGLAERLRAETGMCASLVEPPLTCVAVGAGNALEDFEASARSARDGRQGRLRPHRREHEPADTHSEAPSRW